MKIFRFLSILRLLVATILVLISILLIAESVTFFSLLVDRSSNGSDLTSTIHEYQFLELNNEELSSTVGRVTIPKVIKENEYISYENDNGGSVLISNFGETEYVCDGICFCDDSSRRSSAVNLWKKSVSYLLVSYSTLVAIEKAQAFFETKCQEDFSHNCEDVSNIKSTVDSCNQVNKKNEESKDIYDEDKKSGESRVYLCYGNCLPNLRGSRYGSGRKESARTYTESIDCGKLRKEIEITIYESDLILKSENVHISTRYITTARNKFQERHLVGFCKENSLVDYIWEGSTKNYKTGKVYPKRTKLKGFACVGRSNQVKGNNSSFRNVKCRQIDPKPTTRNNKYWDSLFWERKQEWEDGDHLL